MFMIIVISIDKMFLRNHILCGFTFCLVKLLICYGESMDWICEGTAPCVRVTHPQGGTGDAPANAVNYRISIMVHRRKNDPKLQEWWTQKRDPTWNVVICWYRLLNSKDRIPLTSCKNNLACTVSLIGGEDKQSQSEVYRHFLVEVKFEGHPSTSKVEIIISKPKSPGQRLSSQQSHQSHKDPLSESVHTVDHDTSEHEFSDDDGFHKNAKFQDYVDQMQYRQEMASQNAAHDATRLGALPKMFSDQIDYDRFGEQPFVKHKPSLSMISGSREEPEYEDFGDLSFLQNAYEDEFVEDEEERKSGMGKTGKAFLVLGILLVLTAVFIVVWRKKGKKIKKGLTRIKSRVHKPPSPVFHNSDRSKGGGKTSFLRKYREKLKAKRNRKTRLPHPSGGNVMSKNAPSCSYSKLSLTDSDGSDEEELFNKIPQKSKTYAAWKDVRTRSKNLADQAKMTFSVSARGAADATGRLSSSWNQTEGFLYNCFASIGKWVKHVFAKLKQFLEQHCNPCYECFASIGKWLYQCCVTTSTSLEKQAQPQVLVEFTSDASFEPAPDKQKHSSRLPRDLNGQKRRHSDNYVLAKDRPSYSGHVLRRSNNEDDNFEEASFDAHNRQRRHSDDYVLPKQHHRHSQFSDEHFELAPYDHRSSHDKRISQNTNRLYEDASAHHQRDSYDDYIIGRERTSKSSDRRSRESADDDYHMPRTHRQSYQNRHSGDYVLASDRLRHSNRRYSKNLNEFTLAPEHHLSGNNAESRNHRRMSNVAYNKSYYLESAPRCPRRWKNRKKKILHPSGGYAVVKQPTFSPMHDISGRFFVKPLLPRCHRKAFRTNEIAGMVSRKLGFCQRHSETKMIPGPSCLHHSPKRKCGLHCIQAQHEKRKFSSTECYDELSSTMFSTVSSHRSSDHLSSIFSATSSPTVDGAQNKAQNQQQEKDIHQKVLLTTSDGPPLTKALWKTKEGFRRENQRIDALMKKYEEKSSYVVVDETKKSDTKQKSRLFKLQNKQFTSVNERNSNTTASPSGLKLPTDAEHPDSKQETLINSESLTCPARILTRRPQLPERKLKPDNNTTKKKKSTEKTLELNKKALTEVHKSKTTEKVSENLFGNFCATETSPMKSTANNSDVVASSIHTSEIDGVISEGSVSFPTSQIDFTSSTDESNKVKFKTKIAPSPSCGNIVPNTSDKNRLRPILLKKKKNLRVTNEDADNSPPNQTAAEILKSAAAAFLTSDDCLTSQEDDYYSEKFWPHG